MMFATFSLSKFEDQDYINPRFTSVYPETWNKTKSHTEKTNVAFLFVS